MAKGKRTGKGHETRYARYKSSNQYAANRKKRLERALKKNPENKQIEVALKDIVYRRSTPNDKHWPATKKKVAQLFKLFTGRVDKDIFHNNEKISAPALMSRGWKSELRKQFEFKEQFMFSIRTRMEGR